MNYDEVKELIAIIDQSTLKTFELCLENATVKMSKTDTNFMQAPLAPAIQPAFPAPQIVPTEKSMPAPSKTEDKKEAVIQKEGNLVKSPIVGTFYQSGGPDKPAYVKIGSKVKAGDILCVIEAMKIMNEITSPYDGEIAEIFVENEALVEYGQPLFRIV